MVYRWLLGISLSIALTFGASAQSLFGLNLPPGSFYIGPEGGWTSMVSTKTHVPGLAPIREGFEDGDWNYEDHLVLGVRAGYDMGPWSIEEEAVSRHNQVFRAFDLPFSHINSPFAGQRNSFGLMTNVIYNYPLPRYRLWGITLPPITPHAGLGIGPLHVVDRLSVNSSLLAGSPFPSAPCCLHGSSWEFGYQGIAGVRFEITPYLLLDIDYRYVGTPNSLHFTNIGPSAAGLKYKITGGYQSHDSFFSLVYRFPAPAPPPAAAPVSLPPPPAPPPVISGERG